MRRNELFSIDTLFKIAIGCFAFSAIIWFIVFVILTLSFFI